MPREHKRSGVWKFFTKENPTESSCNICDQVCKSSGNTTNLRNHLRTKHTDAYKALYELSEDLDGVCAASRMEWGQCHSPEVEDGPAEGADINVKKEKKKIKEEGKRKYNKRKMKEDDDFGSNSLKNVKIQEVSSVKDEIIEHDLDIFGRCIAAQLKKLSEKRAILLTMDINTLVGEARIEEIEQLANKDMVATENPHVITVSYGDPLCTNQSDTEGSLEIMNN